MRYIYAAWWTAVAMLIAVVITGSTRHYYLLVIDKRMSSVHWKTKADKWEALPQSRNVEDWR